MTKTTVTVSCRRCSGTGEVDGTCGTCFGTGHHEVNPLTSNEAFVYVCAVRYAINRQTYAGSIVIEELQKVLPRMPYADRKLLEKEVSDALFKHEVDPLTREAWEALVADIQRVEGA